MLADAFRYPLRDSVGRDAVAICTALVLVALVLLRVARTLWPDPLAFVPALLVLVPTVFFAGYLGSVLDVDPHSSAAGFSWSAETVRVGARLVVVATIYLLPAALALALTAFVLLESGGGLLLTVAPTVALLVTVAAIYLLPAALAAAGRDGLRSAFSRASLGGLASGSYFFAWTVATSLVVSVWSILTAVAAATPAAVVLAVVFAYVHVVAAHLLGDGLARSPWSRR